MNQYTEQDIIQLVKEEDVEFIRLQFADIYGTLKNMAVTSNQLEKILRHKCVFDGGAIDGFTNEHKAELFLAPDLDSFTIFPWRPQQGKVARFICDVKKEDGTPFEGDSRAVLKKVVKEAKEMGYTFFAGPECEFFLFDVDESGEPTTKTTEKGGYCDIGPVDSGENARREMVLFLEDMGFEIKSSYHAAEPGQHKIDFKYDEAICTADNLLTFKMVVRIAARRHGVHATFMPKPKQGVKGSGMHFSMSLSKDGKNIFNGENRQVSKEAHAFMAGMMEHIEGMTLINNPIVNSYKRLVPGYNAPVAVTWSETNRNALIRMTHMGEDGARVELRSPDGASNPYLVLAVCLAAGLDGIKRNLKPCTAMEIGDKSEKGLPTSLEGAIKAFEEDCFVQNVIGTHIAHKYMEGKKEEWNQYCKQITDWEVNQYLRRI